VGLQPQCRFYSTLYIDFDRGLPKHRLGISAKATDHHVQSIYTKTGVRGRAPIAMLAIEHGLGSDEKELAWDVIKRKWLNR
jgi:hypothetical protein